MQQGEDRGRRRTKRKADPSFAGQSALDPVAIGVRQSESLRVIEARGLLPVPHRRMKRDEEPGGVVSILRGVESVIDGLEGVRVIEQIDLHAAGIDRGDAFGLSLLHPLNGFLLWVGKKTSSTRPSTL